MAFGLEFGGDTGKIILSVFRIIVIAWGFTYINTLTKTSLPNGLLVALGLVFGGAIGNVIDGVFYDEYGSYPKGSWIRSPHLSSHKPFTKSEGAIIFVKTGHLL